ncbi:MAG TPA: chemotaxis protein CheW [Gemmatimonadaceae bacterium]|nr:chemotaxis protein CheW [Gemmatimonadaceae bacterium]
MVLIASGAESYILCGLAGTTYALRSDDIEQLEMVGHLTPVPNAPAFVDGVTSVRGRVIPAISLRARFGFERQAHDLRSRLIVVRSENRSVGLIVDSAREFAAIPESAIQPPPEGLVELSTRYLRGVAHLGERLVLILDVGELLRVADAVPAISTEVLPVLS